MKDRMSRVDATRFIDFDFLDCSQLSLIITPLPLYPLSILEDVRLCS
jgi:hypothetical protein